MKENIAFVEYGMAKECKNPEAWFLCRKCERCGRKFENGYMVDDGGTHTAEYEE